MLPVYLDICGRPSQIAPAAELGSFAEVWDWTMRTWVLQEMDASATTLRSQSGPVRRDLPAGSCRIIAVMFDGPVQVAVTRTAAMPPAENQLQPDSVGLPPAAANK